MAGKQLHFYLPQFLFHSLFCFNIFNGRWNEQKLLFQSIIHTIVHYWHLPLERRLLPNAIHRLFLGFHQHLLVNNNCVKGSFKTLYFVHQKRSQHLQGASSGTRQQSTTSLIINWGHGMTVHKAAPVDPIGFSYVASNSFLPKAILCSDCAVSKAELHDVNQSEAISWVWPGKYLPLSIFDQPEVNSIAASL